MFISIIFFTFVLSLLKYGDGLGETLGQRESILQPTLYLYIKNSPMLDFIFGVVIGMELLYFLQQLNTHCELMKQVKRIRKENKW